MKTKIKKYSDEFTLYNLKVSVVGNKKNFVCDHKHGLLFRVVGENISINRNTKMSMYALAAVLPFLPAKQRLTSPNDWMTTDEEIACPDPNCGARFKIEREGKKTFRHSETTVTLLK